MVPGYPRLGLPAGPERIPPPRPERLGCCHGPVGTPQWPRHRHFGGPRIRRVAKRGLRQYTLGVVRDRGSGPWSAPVSAVKSAIPGRLRHPRPRADWRSALTRRTPTRFARDAGNDRERHTRCQCRRGRVRPLGRSVTRLRPVLQCSLGPAAHATQLGMGTRSPQDVTPAVRVASICPALSLGQSVGPGSGRIEKTGKLRSGNPLHSGAGTSVQLRPAIRPASASPPTT